MGLRQRIDSFDLENNSRLLFFLRILLGSSLFFKGILFIQNKSLLDDVFTESLILKEFLWLHTLIPWLHLLGGVFIVIGLFTRIVTIIQIPVLVGAILLVHKSAGVLNKQSEIIFSILVLLLLIIFFIMGGGLLSCDQSLKKGVKI